LTSPDASHPPGKRRGSLSSDARALLAPASGALYVHIQAENGVAHRTIVVQPGRVRVLRTLLSGWGLALLLAIGGSWVYFAVQSVRVPVLAQRVAELQAERARVDTLGARLLDLQIRYDQVQRMLGVMPADAVSAPDSASRRRIP